MDIIFFDVDGTLVGPSGSVSEELWARLDAARRPDRPMCVCTGRPSGGVASRVAARLDPDAPHIFHGGGVVRRVHMVNGEAMEQSPELISAIRPEILGPLVETARDRSLTLELYTPDEIYVDRLTPEARDHATLLDTETRQTDLMEMLDEALVVKAQWVIRNQPDTASELENTQVPGCHVAHGVSPVMPDTAFLTITRKDSDKGGAVLWVCRMLGIAPDRAAAVGDSPGDLSMLDAVGHPFVMAEAPEWMRERYPVLGSIDEDGAAEIFAR